MRDHCQPLVGRRRKLCSNLMLLWAGMSGGGFGGMDNMGNMGGFGGRDMGGRMTGKQVFSLLLGRDEVHF